MITEAPDLTKKKARKVFRGITWAARELGVTRQHLYLVLTGERSSPKAEQARRLLGLSGGRR